MNIDYNLIAQIGIAVCGVAAIWLTQDPKESRRRWACVLGLLGQPFWFYASYAAGQWGIFALCFLYTLSWGRGFYAHWITPRLPLPPAPVAEEVEEIVPAAAPRHSLTTVPRYWHSCVCGHGFESCRDRGACNRCDRSTSGIDRRG